MPTHTTESGGLISGNTKQTFLHGKEYVGEKERYFGSR